MLYACQILPAFPCKTINSPPCWDMKVVLACLSLPKLSHMFQNHTTSEHQNCPSTSHFNHKVDDPCHVRAIQSSFVIDPLISIGISIIYSVKKTTSVSSFHSPFGLAFAKFCQPLGHLGTQAEAPVESIAFVVVAWAFGIPGASNMFASHADKSQKMPGTNSFAFQCTAALAG